MSERRPDQIVLLPGDGIGPEVVSSTERLIEAVGGIETAEHPIGVPSVEAYGVRLAEETVAACADSDGILLGAVSIDAFREAYPDEASQNCLLKLRQDLKLFGNLRPAKEFPVLTDRERPRPIDLMIVRELSGGMYFGKKYRDRSRAYDQNEYSHAQVVRIARLGFETARARAEAGDREPKLTSVDKANVLESSKFWREIVTEIAAEYPDVELDHLLVDNADAQLTIAPERFDVMVMENLFGDILSDHTAAEAHGTLGLAPSASVSESGPPAVEPIHGSAPDIAGEGIANPLATHLSLAMLLRERARSEDAARIEAAVEHVLDAGYRTPDLMPADPATREALIEVGTAEMTDAVIAAYKAGT